MRHRGRIALLALLATWTFQVSQARAQSHATDPDLAAQLLELEQERAENGLRGPIALSAVGALVFGTGAVLVVDAALFSANICADELSTDFCYDRGLVRGYAIAGGALMAVGAPMLAAGLPWLFRRLRRRRELGRQIKQLRQPVALQSVELQLHPHLLGARTTFVF